jgi:hypothetical protein
MKWAGHVACKGDRSYSVLMAELREIDHLEDLGTDGRIKLQWISKKWEGVTWTVLLWLRWCALNNAIMNLWVPSNATNLSTS